MSLVIGNDPFSLAFTGLWSTLNASPAFTSVVPTTNQIHYDMGNRQPEKVMGPASNELPADRPLVRIQPRGGVSYLPSGIASNSTKLVKRYQILVALGDLLWCSDLLRGADIP